MRRWRDFCYELDKQLDMVCLRIASVMPARLRMWVVVDATSEARRLYPAADGYAGPDGLGYKHIYDGALREKLAA